MLTRGWFLVAGYLGVATTLVVWLRFTSDGDLRHQLISLSPLALQISFLVMLTAGVIARRAIGKSLPHGWHSPLTIGILAFVLVSVVPPRTHRIFYDEDIYANVAQNIVWEGSAQMCNEGIIEFGEYRCLAAEHNKEPNAFPFALSLAFRLAGVSETAAHMTNRLLFAVGAMAVYWVAVLLFGHHRAALASALLFVLTPENLRWGATVAVEPGAAAFVALALGAWLLFLRDESPSTGALAARLRLAVAPGIGSGSGPRCGCAPRLSQLSAAGAPALRDRPAAPVATSAAFRPPVGRQGRAVGK